MFFLSTVRRPLHQYHYFKFGDFYQRFIASGNTPSK